MLCCNPIYLVLLCTVHHSTVRVQFDKKAFMKDILHVKYQY